MFLAIPMNLIVAIFANVHKVRKVVLMKGGNITVFVFCVSLVLKVVDFCGGL
tara:strand:+ start:721 stop:876 length:156 start_codon:yes stop_codon:yes gene_type:complete